MLPFVCLFLSLFLHTRSVRSDVPPFLDSEDYQFSKYGAYPKQGFFSDPTIVGPVANVIVPPQQGVSPHQLVTWSPHGDEVPAHGPQLLDAESLSVVYQGPTFDEDNFGITVQSCNGSDYLVWWSGTNIDGRAAGHFYILNSTYHSVWNVSSIGLKLADAHDIFITPDCHTIITVYEPKPYELEDWALADNAWLLDSYLQEIDLATNELVFQWRASDHIDMHDSLWIPQIAGWDNGWQGVNKQDAWDFFHINSVEKDWKGNYLISARHMNALYYLDGVTGAVLWTLGGKQNDFRDLNDGYATDFAWQHHARWADEELTTISVFDDRNCRYIKSADPISRGALITLDFEHMTAKLKANYRAPSHIESFRKGGMQVLPNGNVLLGFGNQPAFTEYAANGSILWDVRMGPVMAGYDRETADNYRSYKVNWTGTPHWSPKIAAGPSVRNVTEMMAPRDGDLWPDWSNRTSDTVYFSWNGATELRRWMLFAAPHPLELDAMDSLYTRVNKTGFETSVFVGAANNKTRYFRAVALAAEGEMLAATPILDMRTGVTYQRAKDVLMGSQRNWWDGSRSSRWDDAVAKALEDSDDLVSLRQEWDQVRFGGEKGTTLGPAVLVFVVLLVVLGWIGWRQLRKGFEVKYGEKKMEEGSVGERMRLKDVEDEGDGQRKLWLMYGWRQ